MNKQSKVALRMSILFNIALVIALLAVVGFYKREVDGLNDRLVRCEATLQTQIAASDSDFSDNAEISETAEAVTTTSAAPTGDADEVETTAATDAVTTSTSVKKTTTSKRTTTATKPTTTTTTAKPTTTTTTAASGDNDGDWVEGWY